MTSEFHCKGTTFVPPEKTQRVHYATGHRSISTVELELEWQFLNIFTSTKNFFVPAIRL
jgi:hypothetical protein